jgi:predicted RND superfamily exporter protein
LRSKGATELNNPPRGGWRSGSYHPLVAPGNYTAKLKVNGQELQTTIVVKPDPRASLTDQDYKMKVTAMNRLNDLLSETHEMINNSESIVRQLKELKEKMKSDQEMGSNQALNGEIDQAIKKMEEYMDDVLRRPPPNMNYRQRPRLKEEIGSLMYAVDGATARPSTQQSNRSTELNRETQDASNQLERIITEYVDKINDKLKDMPQIVVKKPVQKEM